MTNQIIKLWAGFYFSDAGEQEVEGVIKGKSIFVTISDEKFRLPLEKIQSGETVIRGSWAIEAKSNLTQDQIDKRIYARENWYD